MAWIAFDQNTNEALHKAELRGKVRISSGDPLTCALNRGDSSVVLLRNDDESVFILTIRKSANQEFSSAHITATPEKQISYIGGGFLGLTDEVESEQEPKEQRGWWKKLWS